MSDIMLHRSEMYLQLLADSVKLRDLTIPALLAEVAVCKFENLKRIAKIKKSVQACDVDIKLLKVCHEARLSDEDVSRELQGIKFISQCLGKCIDRISHEQRELLDIEAELKRLKAVIELTVKKYHSGKSIHTELDQAISDCETEMNELVRDYEYIMDGSASTRKPMKGDEFIKDCPVLRKELTLQLGKARQKLHELKCIKKTMLALEVKLNLTEESEAFTCLSDMHTAVKVADDEAKMDADFANWACGSNDQACDPALLFKAAGEDVSSVSVEPAMSDSEKVI